VLGIVGRVRALEARRAIAQLEVTRGATHAAVAILPGRTRRSAGAAICRIARYGLTGAGTIQLADAAEHLARAPAAERASAANAAAGAAVVLVALRIGANAVAGDLPGRTAGPDARGARAARRTSCAVAVRLRERIAALDLPNASAEKENQHDVPQQADGLVTA